MSEPENVMKTVFDTYGVLNDLIEGMADCIGGFVERGRRGQSLTPDEVRAGMALVRLSKEKVAEISAIIEEGRRNVAD